MKKGMTPGHIIAALMIMAVLVMVFGRIGTNAVIRSSNTTTSLIDFFCLTDETDPAAAAIKCVGIEPNVTLLNASSFSCRLPDSDKNSLNDLACESEGNNPRCFSAKNNGYAESYKGKICAKIWKKQIHTGGATGSKIFCNNETYENYCYTIHSDGTAIKFKKSNGDVIWSQTMAGDNNPFYSIDCDPSEDASAHCYVGGVGEVFVINKQSAGWHKNKLQSQDANTRHYRAIQCDATYCFVAIRAQDILGNKNVWLSKFSKSDMLNNQNQVLVSPTVEVSKQDSPAPGDFQCKIHYDPRRANINDLYCERNPINPNEIANCFLPITVFCDDLVSDNENGRGWLAEVSKNLEVYGTGWPVKYWEYYALNWEEYNNLEYPYPYPPGQGPDVNHNFDVNCNDGEYCYVAHDYGILVRIHRYTFQQSALLVYGGQSMTAIDCIGNSTTGKCYTGHRDGTFGWVQKKVL